MNIYHKIIQFLNQSASPEEQQQIESWKNESADNLKALQEITKLHSAANKLKEYTPVDEGQAWQKVSAQTGLKEDAKVFKLSNFMKASAAIFLICLTAFFVLKNNVDSNTSNLYTSEDLSQSIQLNDGTKVILDSHSSLESIADRYVVLDGRANFNVTTTADKENFTVKFKGGKVTVLGTQFTVLATGDLLEVNVTEGHVKLDYVGRSIDCYANDVVRLDNGTIALTKNTYENLDSWISHELSFKEEPLYNVLRDISKHFKTSFIVDDALEIKGNCLLTSTFKNPSIDDVIKELKTILDAKIIKQNNSYVIVSINC